MSDDALFRALADASRRALLDRLHVRNGQTLNDLCSGLDMTRQAVSKHLALLEDANLVTTRREGREKRHFINPVPIAEIAERWIGKFERSAHLNPTPRRAPTEHERLAALTALKRKLEGDTDA